MLMISGGGNDPLQVLAAAVTPVVLVSASAILVSGVNARYMSISDRMRTLSREYREEHTTVARKASIARQLVIFQVRIRLVSHAVQALYVAVMFFIVDAMLIGATSWRQTLAMATLPLFGIGIGLILIAIVCELRELHMSGRTIAIDITDTAPPGRAAGA